MTNSRLAQRHALITGALGGIGLAVTEGYLREGARCTAVDIVEEVNSPFLALLEQYPESLQYRQMDVTDLQSIDTVIADAETTFGLIDILFNNAAVFDLAPLLESSVESYQKIFDVNVKGAFFTLQAVLKRLVANKQRGNMINMASQAGRRGEALVSHYCASKAAVISYTQSSALAMAPHNITVNAIAPGVIDTPMWEHVDALFAKYENRQLGEKKKLVGEEVPLGRMGDPEDLVGAAIFLASKESNYITAQTLNVDGGCVMS